ncbi:uncharacterized protein HMPREF1541_09734 [Cyphellophora europaea CBS 101466]|uniref:Uncharacterized protein n=1 Tax=Cyphellophora europaea (strain CBS 101466) TaxID=1220924 RepID=W2SAE1_CYPE1|nr:uncharacterized protein HMPREF1541_09734 [Cyphellophora europaea CBS 101466]ETN44859.1 hypothetical protein HMPREF1541_09734 [Cyphellophora europaea CBS 101466]
MKASTCISTLLASVPLALAAFREGCPEASWDSDVDFWETKFESSESNPFAAEYNNTFVKIRNRQRRHILLHCTNEPPPESVTNGSLVVKVPVDSVEALDGFSQHLIEMLGMSHTIARVGPYDTVTSSCVRGRMRENVTYDEENWDKAPEANVTLHGDVSQRSDASRILIINNGQYAPLKQLGYLKLVSMLYGLEEEANSIYNAIASSYRCAASNINSLIVSEDYPQGAFLSAVEQDGSDFAAYQNEWWKVIASDAGVRLVNLTSDLESLSDEGTFGIPASDGQSTFARESWAIIDTTQHNLGGLHDQADRLDLAAWKTATNVANNAYAVRQEHVYLTDKQTNRNRRHNFPDRGPARPDLVLRDVISFIMPSFDSAYETSFLRPATNPEDHAPQRRISDNCAVTENAVNHLNITECELPAGTGGYHASGTVADAYGHDSSEVQSLAVGGGSAGLSAGQKAGISIGAIGGGLLLAGAAAWWFVRRKRAAKQAGPARFNGPMSINDAEKGPAAAAKSLSDTSSN